MNLLMAINKHYRNQILFKFFYLLNVVYLHVIKEQINSQYLPASLQNSCA